MKADPTAQARLADLADIDTALLRLAHRRSRLPEQEALDAVTQERNEARESAARVRIAVEDLDRAVSKIEGDVSAVRTRRSKDEQLLGSAGLPAKQVTEIDHELGTLRRRQEELENHEIELLERREALQADLDHSGAVIDELETRIGEATTARDAALVDVEEAQTTSERERGEVASGVPDDLLALYSRLLDETGRGAGVFTGGRCTACSMELDRSSISTITAAAADEVVQCPECRAILVRSPK